MSILIHLCFSYFSYHVLINIKKVSDIAIIENIHIGPNVAKPIRFVNITATFTAIIPTLGFQIAVIAAVKIINHAKNMIIILS